MWGFLLVLPLSFPSITVQNGQTKSAMPFIPPLPSLWYVVPLSWWSASDRFSPGIAGYGNSGRHYEFAVLYIQVYFLGVIPKPTSIIWEPEHFRAIGDSKRPLYFLIAGCITNIVLDILFVVVFRMGVLGAALATIISQAVSALLVLLVLTRTREIYRLIFRQIRLDGRMLRRIIRIGLPAGLQSVMYSFSNVIIQTAVNGLGTDTVAAWTAYSKIDCIFWMIISAFGISITTFVGQNFGAGKMDRVKKGIRVCLGMSVISTLALTGFLYVFGETIFHIFTADVAVLEKGMEILHFLVPTFITYVAIEIYSGSLRGVGDTWIPMMLTCLGVCVLFVSYGFWWLCRCKIPLRRSCSATR